LLISGRFDRKDGKIKLIPTASLWARHPTPASQLIHARLHPVIKPSQLRVEKRGREELVSTGLQTAILAPPKSQSANISPSLKLLWKPLVLKSSCKSLLPFKVLSWAISECSGHCSAGQQQGSLCSAGLGVRALPSAGEGAELLGTGQGFRSSAPQFRLSPFSNV